MSADDPHGDLFGAMLPSADLRNCKSETYDKPNGLVERQESRGRSLCLVETVQTLRTPVPPNPEFPPWCYVTSTELARLCGVSMQTVWNWRVRNQGPVPIQDRSRKNWYRLADILSWLDKTRSANEFIAEWIVARFPFLPTDEMALQTTIAILEKNKLVKEVRKPKLRSSPKYVTAA